MSFLKQILNVSTESDRTDLAATDETVVDVSAATAQMDLNDIHHEEEQAEVIEPVVQSEVATDIVADATEVAEDVTETARTIADDQGSLSAEGFSMFKVAIESLHNSVGIPSVFNRSYKNVSVESFQGSSYDRASATQIALEAADEGNTTAWEKIKAFFRRIWEGIKNFVKWIFSSKHRMKRRVETAINVAKDSKDVKIKAEEFSGIKKAIGNTGLKNINDDVSGVGAEFVKQMDNLSKASDKYIDFVQLFSNPKENEIIGKDQEDTTLKAIEYLKKNVVPFAPVVGGKSLSALDKLETKNAYDSLKSLKYEDPLTEHKGELKGEVSIKDLAKSLEEAFKLFNEFLEDAKKYNDAVKVVAENLEKTARIQVKGITGVDPGESGRLGKKWNAMNAKWWISAVNVAAPTRFSGHVLSGMNIIAKAIIKNADAESKEKNKEEIKADAKEGDVQAKTDDSAKTE